ncbi:NAD-dependent epimerase/dehydratase family protein [Nocardioides pocheonensis]|uniref:NAD-dependent epimerase/dehydratase family protein n=1 Tax=Nocardioides pocheonensis TaxID=661485 RepID=A0A3N0H032_9ACTN|nr:NAD-dependent epimerase/dehydratase family protein [Nocardioides pocheonensis]RNM17708.1 NAD-dependent epimerase/dehydratase family protein [Nocardioides pocheonensis]
MRVLVLGGTHHVGRATVDAALSRGDRVTTLTRGVSGHAVPGAEARHADRLDPEAVREALGADTWDAVVDTWSHQPVAVRDSARLLAGRAPHYTYISSRSVYTWPMEPGSDESAPVVDGDPASTDAADYAAAKRGGELAVQAEFDGDVLLPRAVLVLGPYEVVGRLPWWLNRIAAGGRVPAPGPRDRPLQYVDARDLAAWVLDAAERGVSGAYNTVSPRGHTTIGALLDQCVAVTGSDAELVWVTPEAVEAAGLSGWTDLPIWVPPTGELAALHDCDVSAAHEAGLRCRPMEATVADTWAWLEREGTPAPPSARAGELGLSAEEERRLLGAVG